MKPSILIIHNKYLFRGGEDVVVESETETLRRNGYDIRLKIFNNEKVSGIKGLLFLNRLYFNISAFVEIYRLVKKHRIQFVHVHNLFYNASPSVLWAAKAAGAKTIMTLHNYRLFCLNALFFREGNTCTRCLDENSFKPGIRYNCFKNKSFSALLASSLRFHWIIGSWHKKTDLFVVINPLMKQFLLQKGVSEQKILLKPNFLPSAKTDSIIAQRQDYYFFAGRLEKEKGIEHLISAFKENGRKIIIAGEGSLLKEVKQAAGPSVIYIGQQGSEQIMHHLRTCKALIFPSICLEGSPIILIEALANGTPIIAAETVTTRNILPGLPGKYLYETGNKDSLIAAVRAFEESEDKEKKETERLSEILYNERFSELSYLRAAEQIYS